MAFLNELHPVGTLNPLGHFCCTIGHLPTSYMLSLTYEEQILWLCNYVEENVLEAINKNAESVLELQELYIELKNYVDNYFDNLDVQEEINNKLDEMVTSGTMAEIINQEIFGQLNERIEELESDIKPAGLYMPSLLSSVGSEMISLLKNDETAILFDTGRATSVAGNKLYLESVLGEQKIDAIFISHYHGDHMGGLEGLADLYSDNITVYLPLNFIPYFNGDGEDIAPTIAQRTQVLTFLTNNDINYVEIDTDRTISIGDFEISTTNSNTSAYSHYNLIQAPKYNDYSMNCLVTYGKTKLLFPGDSTVRTQDYLMSQNQVEKVNILCSFHHGYERYKNTKYMKILNPDYEYYSVAPSSWDSVTLLQYDYAYNTKPLELTTQAFNDVEFTITKESVEMTKGNSVKENMFVNKVQTVYIDPNFTGIPDGTELAPYKSIAQAFTYLPKLNGNITIYLKGGDYTYLRFSSLTSTIQILPMENETVNFSDIQVYNCQNIYFNGIHFKSNVIITSSNAYFNDCDFQTEETTSGNVGTQISRSIVEFNACTFSHTYTGLYAYVGSYVTSIGCTFNVTQNAIFVNNSTVIVYNYTRTNGVFTKSGASELKTVDVGTTAQRPSFGVSNSMRGYKYFDTQLGKPVFYYNNTTTERWIDATGTVV